jgi:hypothetical protein
MTGFTWRVMRPQYLTAAVAIAIVAIVAAVTGPHLAQLYASTVGVCNDRHSGCAAAAAALAGQDGTLRLWLDVLVVVVPGLIGMFWGAPLVARELEDGTFRLAWTQSITRARWVIVRLLVTGLASVAVAGLVSLVVTWWASPLDRAGMSQFSSFDERGIVPLGYAAFAFTLGVAAGTLVRRTIPAMLLTLVGFVAVRLTVKIWLRPFLITPLMRSLALDPATTGYGSSGYFPLLPPATLMPSPPDIPNGWITSIGVVSDHGGARLTATELARFCPGIGSGRGPSGGQGGHVPAPQSVVNGMHDCVARVGTRFHELVSYQPASRYWPLQWYELAIFLVAAVVLAALCIWRVRRIA